MYAVLLVLILNKPMRFSIDCQIEALLTPPLPPFQDIWVYLLTTASTAGTPYTTKKLFYIIPKPDSNSEKNIQVDE